ncbi:MAG: fructose-6-phosphate aldolase [Alphaproteobacteria bacterium]|jgi:transaldolase|nr:fructose-6-phosphate aldolase [Alphaproteobacteria bacterium]
MEFFIDSANVFEVEQWASTGMIMGVTTNPTLIAQSGRAIKDVLAQICSLVEGPISAEVTLPDVSGMLAEAEVLSAIADNIIIKVPLTKDGLKACDRLTKQGIGVNVTLCFSAAQALLAANSGATFISPFMGRLDDIGESGVGLIADIREIYEKGGYETAILAASVRNADHVVAAAKAGAHVATLPPKVLEGLYAHPLTTKGLELFEKDWQATGQTILDK